MRNWRGLAYVDTNILLTMIDYEKHHYESQMSADKMMYDYRIKIPQVVLGEAVAIMLRDGLDQQDAHARIDRIETVFAKATFDSDRFPPPNNGVIKEAYELSRISDVINDMDSLILAHAIMDSNATHLFTRDASLNNKRVVGRLRLLQDQGIRDKGLNILAV